jgi:hypothetical protein
MNEQLIPELLIIRKTDEIKRGFMEFDLVITRSYKIHI